MVSGALVSPERSSLDITTNTRGRALVDFMEERGLLILNERSLEDTPAKYPYMSSAGKSVFDQCWVSLPFCDLEIKTLVNEELSLLSDHIYIL